MDENTPLVIYIIIIIVKCIVRKKKLSVKKLLLYLSVIYYYVSTYAGSYLLCAIAVHKQFILAVLRN